MVSTFQANVAFACRSRQSFENNYAEFQNLKQFLSNLQKTYQSRRKLIILKKVLMTFKCKWSLIDTYSVKLRKISIFLSLAYIFYIASKTFV